MHSEKGIHHTWQQDEDALIQKGLKKGTSRKDIISELTTIPGVTKAAANSRISKLKGLKVVDNNESESEIELSPKRPKTKGKCLFFNLYSGKPH
jgi:hypothetical protein